MERTVNILIFNGVEVLDFCGPYEVFSVAGRQTGADTLTVHTVAERRAIVRAANGLVVQPDFAYEDAPAADLLVIPGGRGTRELIKNEPALAWIAQACEAAEVVLITFASLCPNHVL